MDPIYAIGSGLVSGAAYGIFAWKKNVKDSEPMDWQKFGTTVFLGGVSGVIASTSGMQIDAAWLMLAQAGFAGVVENVWKTVWRRYLGKLFGQ